MEFKLDMLEHRRITFADLLQPCHHGNDAATRETEEMSTMLPLTTLVTFVRGTQSPGFQVLEALAPETLFSDVPLEDARSVSFVGEAEGLSAVERHDSLIVDLSTAQKQAQTIIVVKIGITSPARFGFHRYGRNGTVGYAILVENVEEDHFT